MYVNWSVLYTCMCNGEHVIILVRLTERKLYACLLLSTVYLCVYDEHAITLVRLTVQFQILIITLMYIVSSELLL